MGGMLEELGVTVKSVKLFCDNQGAIQHLKNHIVVTTLSVRGLCVSLCSWHTYCVRNCLPEHVLGRSAA
jgi:hypothetical protein